LVTVSDYSIGHHINNVGQISFLAAEDSGAEAIWVKTGNNLRLVAKTGQTIQGVGTIANFDIEGATMFDGGRNNDLGQVFFAANMTDGSCAIFIATPSRSDSEDSDSQ